MKHRHTFSVFATFLAFCVCAAAEPAHTPRLGVVCETPAQARPGVAKSRAWEQSLLTGNGAMGAMVPGELAHEEIYLSHARIFLPRVMNGRYFELGKYREKARELALAGREKEIWDEVIQKASDESGYLFKRDPFMGAVSLVVDTPELPDWSDAPGYRRMTDFERGECTVRTDDYERRIFVSRPDGVIAMRVKDEKKRPFTVKFETISNGRPSGDAAIQRIREKDGYMYYRVDFRKENGKNPFHGYEAVGLRKGDEVFVKIYPLPFGTDSMFETAKRELSAAADMGYARLLERHAPIMKELMGRVTLDLPDRDLVRKFHACRYNIISSTGPGGVLPNLQGLWAGSWSAPYNGSYTVDGNMPCAMSFWTRGNTPEFNESLYEWIMRYYADFREAAKKGYSARGIHIPGQVTTTGLETAYYRNVELMWWHGGAGWMTGYLWRWYEATQDIEVLKKVYPLLKDAADYICDCMEEMPDGTLGFAPGYSPENAPHGDFRSQGDVMNPDLPKGGYSTMNNPTMDISVAKQSIDYATKAAKILGRDEASVREWAQKRARLPKYAVSKDGFWAEWLIPGTPDNNSHRHVSHVYALYDEAPAEILTNAAFVAAIKKTLDARMSFHEKEHHMAFGVTQIGYAAAKVGDAAVMERAIKLLQEAYFTDALGTLHDPGWLFNIDISGGFPGIIADALITKGPDGGFQVLNAKPASWTHGSISGLLLPGGIKVKKLSWQGDSYELELLHLDGRVTVQSASPLAAPVYADERIIPQGANVAPNGDRLDVTSKCLRLNGRAQVPLMGEIHYSRIPQDEWAKSLATMREGGISIVATYVFWNHHEWKEDEWDFTGNRDLSAFLEEVGKAGLWAVVRLGPWDHGECREGGFPDWLLDKAYLWAGGDAKKVRQILRSRDSRFMAETKKLFERIYPEVASHLWKNGGPVIGIQLENESRGPWPYYQALKKLAVETGYDVPMYTRTGWPRLNGPETTFGEMIPLYGDYAEGFWDRELKSMPGSYRDAFVMRPSRTSSVIATEQLGKQKSEDAKGAEMYPYFTCELGGGMASSYHRRLVMEPMDAFSLAVVKLGSGSNLPGFYMYHGGSNPTDFGVNMAESQRGRFTNYNDLPVVSYEFMAPVSEFGEPQYAYWMIKALADFCRENAEELAVADPVFVSKSETRRGRFIFHNDYVRRINPSGECWIGVEKDGKVERLLDGRALAGRCPPVVECRRLSTTDLTLLKGAGTPPPVAVGPNGVAMPPEESAWGSAAEYDVPFKTGDTMLEIAYEGDMARLYADGKLVQDDFWKGLPIRYALRRLPKGTKRLVLKVLPRGAGWNEKIYIDKIPSLH